MKSDDSKKDVPENEDYMDADMRTMDENVKKRIQDILQDYKDQMQKYNPPSGDDDKPKTGTEFDIFRLPSPPHSRWKINIYLPTSWLCSDYSYSQILGANSIRK